MRIGATTDGEMAYNWFIKKLEDPLTGETEKINILVALGEFNDKELLMTALEYSLKHVPRGNRYIPIVTAARNLPVVKLIWKWYLDHLEELEQLHSTHYEQILSNVVALGGLGREEEVTNFFRQYLSEKDLASDTIKMTLERLKINSRLRKA